jgi:hypothetical protein
MFSIKANQNPMDPNGWCQLRIEGLLLSAQEALEISFKRAGSTKPFLAEYGWQQNATWLLFEDAHALDGAAVVRIGPQQTKFLSQVTTVEVAVRRVGQQADRAHRARVAWPRIILETEDRSGMPPITGEEAPAVLPPDAPVPVPAAELNAITAEDRPVCSADRPRATRTPWPLIAGTAIVSVALAVLAVLYFLKLPPFEATALEERAPLAATASGFASDGARAFTEEDVRRFLAPNPGPAASVTEAEAYARAGHPDLALLIYRHADRQGNPVAAKAIGRMYDPATYNRETSPFPAPDADQAAEYYHRATEAGDVEAQYLLGRLLTSGATSGESDVERGVVWLERAAASGHAEAKKLLLKFRATSPDVN